MTPEQERMAKAHGTPREFSAAVWAAMPEFLSWAEAEDAVAKYQAEWDAAGLTG